MKNTWNIRNHAIDLDLFCLPKVDQSQTRLTEKDLAASQMELAHKAILTDRDEHISRITADMRILEDRLSKAQQQVWIKMIT